MTLDKLMNNPYAWALLSICTIVALVFAIYTWIVGKKKKKLSCFESVLEVVKAGKSVIPKLGLSYEGHDIEDLKIIKYVIWNSGNEVLNWSDIVEVCPLQIICNNEARILDGQILEQSDETNVFRIIEKTDDCIKIKFDYANANDGIILQVLFTGDISELNVKCKIKGGKELNYKKGNSKKKRKNHVKQVKNIVIQFVVLCCFLSIMAVIAVLDNYNIISLERLENASLNNSMTKAFGILMAIYGVILWSVCYHFIKQAFHLDIPAKLRKSFENEDAFEVNLEEE